MALDVFLPARSIEKLVESLRCRQLRMAETKRVAFGGQGRPAEDEKVTSGRKGFRHVEVALAILVELMTHRTHRKHS